jgi:hydrogenase maturation factor
MVSLESYKHPSQQRGKKRERKTEGCSWNLAIIVKLIHDATKRGIAINTISSHTSH